MTLTKEATQGSVLPQKNTDPKELEALNAYTKTALTQDEVYLFALRLCDNHIDREGECFDIPTLEQLAPLFVGTSGIFDHNWSAKEQTARLYRTELVTEAFLVPETQEVSTYLKGYAYLLRNEQNAALIAEIEAGIKKEVSISCAVQERICSICGADRQQSPCPHLEGEVYEEKPCFIYLRNPTDAYEWSFVAVPAQRQAGVLKGFAENILAKTFGEKPPEAWQPFLQKLKRQAKAGVIYQKQLYEDTLRAALLAHPHAPYETLQKLCARLDTEELLQMKESFHKDAALHYPLQTQLQHLPEDAPDTKGNAPYAM